MGMVWLSQLAVNEMLAETEDKAPNETGGVLMGYWSTPWEEAVIVKAIGPGPNAIHTPYAFKPDGEYHWKEIEIEYNATEGRHTYLGDWHSHPSGGLYISPADRATLVKIAKCKEARAPQPLMMILSGVEQCEAGVWRLEPKKYKRFRYGWHETPMEIRLFTKS